jgi:hypothetical protein
LPVLPAAANTTAAASISGFDYDSATPLSLSG